MITIYNLIECIDYNYEKNEINILYLSDFIGTIGELKEELILLENKYGEDSEIWFDAGYNNVNVIVRKIL